MCGPILKLSFFLFSLVFWLLPVCSYSDVVLTDQEYQTIMDSLIESDQELTKASNEMETLKMELKRADELLTEQAVTLAMLKINSDLLSKSYEMQKKRIDLIWLDRTVFGILGAGLGYSTKALVGLIE